MRKKNLQILEFLPGYSCRDRPANLKTRREWKRKGKQVRNGETPVARLTWTELQSVEVEQHNTDGTVTPTWEKHPVSKECGLFTEDQTKPYRGSRRTWAIEIFRRYFAEDSSRQHYIWWVTDHWQSCHGKLQEWQLKSHLKGSDRYGVRGGKWTRFLAIDLDLHSGDQAVFLDQLRVLLDEFHGKDGWHFQVADQKAGGIHLIQCFCQKRLLSQALTGLRRRLQDLDQKHPELGARARAAGMKTLGELEIFPSIKNGFRLPLCAGRTMLLDRPLPLVFNNRMGREVQDVVGYVSWLSGDEKTYMPAEDIFQFVKERLAVPTPKVTKQAQPTTVSRTTSSAGGMADLGRMKAQYRQKLVEFWTGKHTPPDSLNKGIVLLARVLPFYLDDEADAVDLIERYIDELPDHSFSDRLSRGERAEVSRIVRHTVHRVYSGNGGQADPLTSTEKLQATVAAWKRRGFDPTDKATWTCAVNNLPDLPVINFFWNAEDVIKLGRLQKVLNTSLDTVNNALKHLLNLVKHHGGEIAINLVRTVFQHFGIACGHHGKINNVLALLREWGWIYIRSYECWHERNENGEKRPGRARSYGIGPAQAEKFETMFSSNTTTPTNLYIVSHHFQPLGEDEAVQDRRTSVSNRFP